MALPQGKLICIVSPSLSMGGTERALVSLANFFSEKGLKVCFISCLATAHFYHLNDEIKLLEPKHARAGGFLNKLYFYPRLCLFLRRSFKSLNPDSIITFGDHFNILVILSSLGLGLPIFISDRSSPERYGFPMPQLKSLLYPKSSGFIAQTRISAEFNSTKFKSKLNVQVIPNALRDVKLYPEYNREKIVLYTGRFHWEKAPERLIEAFSSIPDRKGWMLYMAGTGPALDRMKEMVANLNIVQEVLFLGKVKDIDELYARASIYVLPSLLEGFPNSLCEAMAAGLPCICYSSIPYEEILSPGLDGMVVEGNSVPELAEAISQLIDDDNLRRQLGARAMDIRKRLNIEVIGNRILEFVFKQKNQI